jgi:hypothetical protein
MTVKIVAFVTVKPGEDDAFIAAARTCVAASRAEPGVLHYDLWRETGGDRRFVFKNSTPMMPPCRRTWRPTISRRSAWRPATSQPLGPKSSQRRPWTSPTES